MHLKTTKHILSVALGASLVVCSLAPGLAAAGNKTTIYFTRHAEKQALLTDAGDGLLVQPSDAKRAEELNEFGEQRAEALADWFLAKGFTSKLTHIFSSQKLRTRQTIAAIAEDALAINGEKLVTSNDSDYLLGDGIQQYPIDAVAMSYEGRLETIDSPSDSVVPTVQALKNLPNGSVALVAMHSGTFYKILDGLGIETSDEVTDEGLFPKDINGKISTFGDVWKVVIRNDKARVKWRKNLQFQNFKVDAVYTH